MGCVCFLCVSSVRVFFPVRLCRVVTERLRVQRVQLVMLNGSLRFGFGFVGFSTASFLHHHGSEKRVYFKGSGLD